MRKAVLAGIRLKDEKRGFNAMFSECRNLCEACHIEVVSEVIQESVSMDPRTAFRKGKLEELSACAKAVNADLIIFANDLSSASVQRIRYETGIEVRDRTALILDIFANRAKSRQAKIQVEAAQLKYDLPRLSTNADHETHIRGGSYRNRGSGELASDVLARKYRARIKELNGELSRIERNSRNAEVRRQKAAISRCAFVGYTNAGKSSLMNALLRSQDKEDKQVFEKDMLFATLDTSVRHLKHHGQEFLLYDTVGFVSHLPRELIDAFHSTLDAARDADLLIHVIDASDPDYQEKIEITRQTLTEIGAGNIPVLRVYNKIDLCKDPSVFPGLCTSTKDGTGIAKLLDEICERLYPVEETMTCFIGYDRMALVDKCRSTCRIEILEQNENGMRIRASGPRVRLVPLLAYKEK